MDDFREQELSVPLPAKDLKAVRDEADARP